MKRLLTTLLFGFAAFTAAAQAHRNLHARKRHPRMRESCSSFAQGAMTTQRTTTPCSTCCTAPALHGDWSKGQHGPHHRRRIAAGMAPMIVIMPAPRVRVPNSRATTWAISTSGLGLRALLLRGSSARRKKKLPHPQRQSATAPSRTLDGEAAARPYMPCAIRSSSSACPMSGLLESHWRSRRKRLPPLGSRQLAHRDGPQAHPGAGRCTAHRALVGRLRRRRLPGDGQYPLLRGHAREGHSLQYRMRDGGHTWRYWQTVLNDAHLRIDRIRRRGVNGDLPARSAAPCWSGAFIQDCRAEP